MPRARINSAMGLSSPSIKNSSCKTQKYSIYYPDFSRLHRKKVTRNILHRECSGGCRNFAHLIWICAWSQPKQLYIPPRENQTSCKAKIREYSKQKKQQRQAPSHGSSPDIKPAQVAAHAQPQNQPQFPNSLRNQQKKLCITWDIKKQAETHCHESDITNKK